MTRRHSSVLRRRSKSRLLDKRRRSTRLFLEALEPRLLLTAELVSVTPDSVAGSDYSTNPVLSSNGDYIAFQSHAPDLQDEIPDTNATQDIYVRDLRSDPPTTVLISRNFSGTASAECADDLVGTRCASEVTAGSYYPDISDDGRFVSFFSFARDLVAGITIDEIKNLYVHDRDADEDGIFDEMGDGETSMTLLNVGEDGTPVGIPDSGSSVRPVMSGNGGFVAFSTSALGLAVDEDTIVNTNGPGSDVYRAPVTGGSVSRVNVDGTGEGTGVGTGGASGFLSIDRDGGAIAFVSSNFGLTSEATGGVDDTNGGVADIFVGGGNKPVEVVTVNADAKGTGDGASRAPAISSNGRHVAFISVAENLVGASDENGPFTEKEDVFVRDLLTDTTTLISRSRATPGTLATGDRGSPGAGISNFATGPAISDTGQFIVFRSNATDLLDPAFGVVDDNERPDIFWFNRDVNGNRVFDEPGDTETLLVTVNAAGTASASFADVSIGTAGSNSPSISRDGRYVAFSSTGRDLIPGGTSLPSQHVYIRDMLTGVTTLVSETTTGVSGGPDGTGGFFDRVLAFSGSGNRVAFMSGTDASLLDPTVTDPPSGSIGAGIGELDMFTSTPPTDLRLFGSRAGGFDRGALSQRVLFEPVAGPVEVAVFRSADAVLDASDVMLDTLTLTGGLPVGGLLVPYTVGATSGDVTLPGVDAAPAEADETDDDYFVLFVTDPDDAIPEFDADPIAEDNTGLLWGGYFESGGDASPVFLHGRDTAGERGRDTITVTADADSLTVTSPTTVGVVTYRLTDVTGLRIRTHGNDDTVSSGPLDDLILGGGGSDLLSGGDGDDTIGGGDGPDKVFGEGGDDDLDGGPGGDLIDGGDGDDIIDGGAGRDTLIGGPGADTIFDGPGDDVVDAGDEDVVIPTPGADPIEGEGETPPLGSLDVFRSSGNASIDFSRAQQAITLDLDTSARQRLDILGNRVQLEGTWPNATLTSFADLVRVRALAGLARHVRGGDGNDTLIFDAEGLPVTARQLGDGFVIEVEGRDPVTVEGFEEVRTINGVETVIDNSDPAPAFSIAGDWSENTSGQGRGGTFLHSADDPGNTATWHFEDLAPGNYQVAITGQGGPGGAAESPFTIHNGGPDGPIATEIAIDQSRARSEFVFDGDDWANISFVEVTTTELTVRLNTTSPGQVIADAVYIKPAQVGNVADVMDDGDPRASVNGGERQRPGAFGGSQKLVTDDNKVTYIFEGLRPNARFDVFGTWPVDAGNATNAPFSILSGDQTTNGEFDQSQAPNDRREFDMFWELLAQITVGDDGIATAEWKRDSSADGDVIADTVMLSPIMDTEAFTTDFTAPLDEQGAAAAEIPVMMTNTGDSPVSLGNVVVEGAGFSLGSVPMATNLPPGASTSFIVNFATNSMGDFDGTASIDTNVIGKDPLVVPLRVTTFEDLQPPAIALSVTNCVADVADVVTTCRYATTILDNGLLEEDSFNVAFDSRDVAELEGSPCVFEVNTACTSTGTFTATETRYSDEDVFDVVDVTGTVRDISGNVGTTSIMVRVVLDAAPVIANFGPPPGSVVPGGESVFVPFDVTEDVGVPPGGVQVLVDGQPILADDELICTDSDTGLDCIAQIPVPKDKSTFTYQLRATDTAGNVTVTDRVTYYVAGRVCLEEDAGPFTVENDGEDVVVQRADGSELARRRLQILQQLVLQGTPGNDGVIINLDNGFPFPIGGGIFDLGGQLPGGSGDFARFRGMLPGGPFNRLTYTHLVPIVPASGFDVMLGFAPSPLGTPGINVRFSGVEPVIDETAALERVVTFAPDFPSPRQLRVVDDPSIPGHTLVEPAAAPLFESISFPKSTEMVILETPDQIVIRQDGTGFSTDWTFEGVAIEDGAFLHELKRDDTTLLFESPRPWQNPLLNRDVNHNGSIEPADVLIVFNELNDPHFSGERGRAVDPTTLSALPPLADFFLRDTDGDGFFSPIDALLIINFLNRLIGITEGEAAVTHLELALVDTAGNLPVASVVDQRDEEAVAWENSAVLAVGPPATTGGPQYEIPYRVRSLTDETEDADLLDAIDTLFGEFDFGTL